MQILHAQRHAAGDAVASRYAMEALQARYKRVDAVSGSGETKGGQVGCDASFDAGLGRGDRRDAILGMKRNHEERERCSQMYWNG